MKTSKLIGAALDWAVAKCEGHETEISNGGWVVFDTHQDNPPPTNDYDDSRYQRYSPSTDWAQGGPIIEREGVAISAHLDGDEWIAEDYWREVTQTGPTPLIAAMRCYVASCLGDEVDVPEELQGETT